MFDKLMAALRAPAPEDAERDPEDGRLALAALMIRVARADDDYATEERRVIRAALADRFALDAAAVDALMAEAERAEAEAVDTVRFSRLIKAAVPYEERAGMLEALWRVALADGGREPEEDAVLRQLAPLIGVTDRDSGLARQRAAAG